MLVVAPTGIMFGLKGVDAVKIITKAFGSSKNNPYCNFFLFPFSTSNHESDGGGNRDSNIQIICTF